MVKIILQLFGGGKGSKTVYQEASVPEASPEEKALLQQQYDYIQKTMPVSENLLNMANGALNGQQVNPDPNWQTLYNNAQGQTAQNQGLMQNLQNGQLPSAYSANRQQVLNNELQGTVGNAITGLADRGILNSTTTTGALNNISQNAANSLASQYNQDLSSQSQLLNQSQQMAMDPITTAATAQEASINVPMQYLAMATGQDAPTQNLLTNLSNNRYSMASPAQTIVQQGNGGLLGGLASGVGSYFGARK